MTRLQVAVATLWDGKEHGRYACALPLWCASASTFAAELQLSPRLQIIGGIDKRRIGAGKTAVEAELASKVPDVLSTGGYIPCCDHSVPPTVSWNDFCYYRQQLTELAKHGSVIHSRSGFDDCRSSC